jgi:general secretion pathway protein G
VVIAIIGILAAVVVPAVMNRPDEARVVAARQDIATIGQALELYRLDNYAYPTESQGLGALVAPPTVAPLAPNWKPGGYLRRSPTDPWGRPYVYRPTPDGLSYEIMSLGADGQPGGSGFAADISSKGL